MKHSYIGITAVFTTTLILLSLTSTLLLAKSSSELTNKDPLPTECHSYYVISLLYIANSSIRHEEYLITSRNVSLGEVIQRSKVVLEANVSNGKAIISPITKNELSYVITYVKVCYPKGTRILGELMTLAREPGLYGRYEVPKNLSKYVSRYEDVINVVRKAFNDWLAMHGLGTGVMSKARLAVYAALFIYRKYIKYTLSPIPHSVNETVSTRRGDCDDMSRVLTELLWSYGIPALMAYGFLVANLTKPFIVNEGRIHNYFIDVGPHAFVIAYLPGIGWISIDLLAGSLITHPFIFYRITNDTSVPKNIGKELMKYYNLVNAKEVIITLPASYVNEALSKTHLPLTYVMEAIANYLLYTSTINSTLMMNTHGLIKGLSSSSTYRALAILTLLLKHPIKYERVLIPRPN